MNSTFKDSQMSLLISFPDQSESFVLGFEAGQIWQEMDGEGKLVIDRGVSEGFPVHSGNMTVIQNMARARGYEIEAKPSGVDGWTAIRLTHVGTGRSKPRLSVVRTADAHLIDTLADSDGDDGA